MSERTLQRIQDDELPCSCAFQNAKWMDGSCLSCGGWVAKGTELARHPVVQRAYEHRHECEHGFTPAEACPNQTCDDRSFRSLVRTLAAPPLHTGERNVEALASALFRHYGSSPSAGGHSCGGCAVEVIRLLRAAPPLHDCDEAECVSRDTP